MTYGFNYLEEFNEQITTKQQDVDSTCGRKISFDVDRDILTLYFTDGTAYEYYNVPISEYFALLRAASFGTYFNKYFRPHYVHYLRIA
jgi:hypothetical protein